jgi:hypothetical protein
MVLANLPATVHEGPFLVEHSVDGVEVTGDCCVAEFFTV